MTKLAIKTDIKTKIGKIPIPRGGASDKEKRASLKLERGIIAYRRGQLGGKSVWHVHYEPYGPKDRVIVLGAAPQGARIVTGKGSADKSATILRGRAPGRSIVTNTGAIDDVIVRTPGGGIGIVSRRDPTVRRPAKPPKQSTGLKSERRGKIFYTRVGSNTLLSRRSLGRRRK